MEEDMIAERIALADGSCAVGSKGTLGILAEPILSVWPVPAAISALWKRAVFAAVIAITARCSLHEIFKSPVIAICKIHGILLFKGQIGALRYIKNPFYSETDF